MVVVLILGLFLAPSMLISAEVPFSANNSGFCGGPGNSVPGRGSFAGGSGFAWQVADVLGVNVDEVTKDWEAGKSYAEIAAARGTKSEELIEKLLAAHKSRLEQYVKSGTLSDQQAELMQGTMEERVEYLIEYKFDGTKQLSTPRGVGCGRGLGRGQLRSTNNF